MLGVILGLAAVEGASPKGALIRAYSCGRQDNVPRARSRRFFGIRSGGTCARIEPYPSPLPQPLDLDEWNVVSGLIEAEASTSSILCLLVIRLSAL
jgi:hypothetical protein